MNLLRKIQNLNLAQRKFIFWSLIIVLAILLVFSFVKSSKKKLAEFEMDKFLEESNFPDIKEEVKNILPEEFDQKIEEIDKIIEEIEKVDL
jgi:hypothetical protein